MAFLGGNFLSLHGRLFGLFRGLINVGDAFIGGDGFQGVLQSSADTLTAHAGGTQAAALPLTALVNRVSVAASPADSVRLPVSQAGMTVLVINDGASSIQIFGAGTETIDAVATATGVPCAAAKRSLFYCPTAGIWQSLQGVKSA